jgi:predicted esterase
LVSLLVGVLVAAPALARQHGEKGEEKPQKQLATTRAELYRALEDFEARWAEHGPITDSKELQRINIELDTATASFFLHRQELDLRKLNELTRSISPTPASAGDAKAALEPIEQSIARALEVEIDPPVYALSAAKKVSAHVRSYYAIAWPGPQSLELALSLEGPKGATLTSKSFRVEPGEAPLDATVELAAPKPEELVATGAWKVRVVRGDAPLAVTGAWQVVARPLDQVRAENQARLDKIVTQNQFITEAIGTCKARNATLTDHPSADRLSELLPDANARSAEIAAEIEALEAGRDPYKRRIGDVWRIVPQQGGGYVPMRVYAPPQAAKEELPLVIAVHDAGGDENMFFELYGRGKLRQLAEQRGFVLACPTYPARPGFGEALFDSLLAQLTEDYRIDGKRVYLLGHGVGAGQVAQLPRPRWDKIAALCCIADGDPAYPAGRQVVTPTLILAGSLDPILASERLEKSTRELQQFFNGIQFRAVPDCGRYLLCEHELESAVDWMLTKKID